MPSVSDLEPVKRDAGRRFSGGSARPPIPADQVPALLLASLHRHSGWRTVQQWTIEVGLDHNVYVPAGSVGSLLKDWARRGITERFTYKKPNGAQGKAFRRAPGPQ